VVPLDDVHLRAARGEVVGQAQPDHPAAYDDDRPVRATACDVPAGHRL
jgi:hypothetical protein